MWFQLLLSIYQAFLLCRPLSCIQLFMTPWTVGNEAPLSMEFSRQEYWSGLPSTSPGASSPPRNRTPVLLHQGRFFTTWTTQEALLNSSAQVSSAAQSCPTLCDPMNCNTLGLPVHHQLLEFTQTHVHRVGDVIQPSHPLSSLSPPAPNSSQHQSLFQWVNSLHEVAKVLEFQL